VWSFVGPCRFGGFDSFGVPVAVAHPNPWVQVAAVTLGQTRNTMTLLPGLLSRPRSTTTASTSGRRSSIRGRVADPGGHQLAAGVGGWRPTLFIANETQHWQSQQRRSRDGPGGTPPTGEARDGSARMMEIPTRTNPTRSVAETLV